MKIIMCNNTKIKTDGEFTKMKKIILLFCFIVISIFCLSACNKTKKKSLPQTETEEKQLPEFEDYLEAFINNDESAIEKLKKGEIAPGSIFALDVQRYSGSEWIDDNTYQYLVEEKSPYTGWYDINSFKLPKKNNSSDSDEWGYYAVNGLGGVARIYSVSVTSETSFKFTYSFDLEDSEIRTCSVTVIDDDTLQFENNPFTETKLHRFGGHTVKNADAVVNDTNVRIRKTPDTSGTIYGKLNTGDKIQILDQSEVKTADGKSNVWYKISAEGWPVCWIFGEYVTKKTQEKAYAAIVSEREAFDAVPLEAGFDMTAKDIWSLLFLDGTWCTESQYQNLKNENLIYYETGILEKSKAVKNDACVISIYLNIENRITSRKFTFHDTTYKINSVEWKNPDQCDFSCNDGFSSSIKIIDSETISVSARGKTEVWKRISSVFDFKASTLAKVTYDGTCIESDPANIKKKTYVNAGSIVEILEKGKQQKIGKWNDYWYRVSYYYCEVNGYINDEHDCTGWIYGAFLKNLYPEERN